tara:strand:+ start:189 stop:506 length:318 start_codon:yes stop_codon:yes gene_type:complete
MSEHKKEVIEAFFRIRFGNPDSQTSYFEEWKDRFLGLDESQIPSQMDFASRRAWGKATGLRYAIIRYNYTEDPVFSIVDLKTGIETTETDFSKSKELIRKAIRGY